MLRLRLMFYTDWGVTSNIKRAPLLDIFYSSLVIFSDFGSVYVNLVFCLRLMFWTDWGITPKIERALLDGSDRQILVTDGVVWPNGLTLDLERSRLYWVDGKLESLEYILYDGSGRKSLLESSPATKQPFAVSMLDNYVYWTDWMTQALYKAHIDSPTDIYLLTKSTTLLSVNLHYLSFQVSGQIDLHL